MRRLQRIICLAVVAAMSFVACDPPETPVDQGENEEKEEPGKANKPSLEIQQADQFAIDMFGSYYLWTAQVKSKLYRLNPDTCKTPIPVVKQIRYHNGTQEVDHWTQLTNDLESMTSAVEGLGLTYGYEFGIGGITNKPGVYFILVYYVVKDGPAEKAGLKRGDIILTIDGNEITASNYYDAFDSQKVKLGVAHLTDEGTIGKVEKQVELVAEDMWEDPILLSKTFDIDGKKVGYLVYNSFDVKSMETLPEVFKQFKSEGIEELIIDLRYNGGGFTVTECELASLIAPIENVLAGDVFQTEVYNAALSQYWEQSGYDTNTYLKTKHSYKNAPYNIEVDVTNANPGISKLYAIVTGGSASASEGLLIGLGPYMDITLIGEQTYGKYCAGYMMSPEDLYGSPSNTDYSKIKNWGMYVMVSMFADKDGKNAAQPDGIPVNIKADDDPFDGYQLGDEDETMLKAALKAAGKKYTRSDIQTRKPFDTEPIDGRVPRGILVKTDLPKFHFGD